MNLFSFALSNNAQNVGVSHPASRPLAHHIIGIDTESIAQIRIAQNFSSSSFLSPLLFHVSMGSTVHVVADLHSA